MPANRASRIAAWLSQTGSLFTSVRFWWAACLLWAGVQAWAGRHVMSPDGASYIDMALETLAAGPAALVNGYWSPGYPALLSVTFFLLQPEAPSLFPVAHLVNLLVFALALAGFTYYLKAWTPASPAESGNGLIPFSFVAFLWFANEFLPLSLVTPDLLMAALILFAAGLCCRLFTFGAGWKHCVALGLVLGAGYYVKAAMFPLSLALLGIMLMLPPNGKGRRGVLLAGFAFLTAAAPLVVLTSRHVERFTIGESARLNYAWYVNGLQRHAGWTEAGAGAHGAPLHPPRILVDKPRVLEFDGPVPGTYPLWYDPSYWYAGARAYFDLGEQVSAIRTNLGVMGDVCLRMGGLLGGAMALVLLARRGTLLPAPCRMRGWLLLWPLAAFLVHVPVHVEPRHIAVFLMLLWLEMYRSLLPKVRSRARIAVLWAVLATLAVPIAFQFTVAGARTAVEVARGQRPDYVLVGEALRSAGLRTGDRLAVVGEAFPAYYASYAGARIVAQVDSDQFWGSSQQERETACDALTRIGVRALVARNRPETAAGVPWQDVASTTSARFSIHLLKPSRPGG